MSKTLPLWLQTVILLSCLTAVVPAKVWAQVEPSERLTAQQVLDGVNYGLDLYRKLSAEQSDDAPLPIKSDWRTFAIGYSQGGAVTLALQRLIEEEGLAGQLHFRGSICGDGPYDLIETMRYYFDDDGRRLGAVPTTKGLYVVNGRKVVMK